MVIELKPKKVLVCGDYMVDHYTVGDVVRISPEAPVPILRVKSQTRRAGGAGNAILNLISLGMQVRALGRVGDDLEGRSFLEEMCREGVNATHIVVDDSYKTPVKNRMISAGQQLMRVDYETSTELTLDQEEKILKNLPEIFRDIEIVAISDYAKGFLKPTLLSAIIEAAKSQQIPVVVDPKGRDFARYKGASILKPNVSEAIAAAGLREGASLEAVADAIFDQVAIDTLMITRSSEGISLFNQGKSRQDFSATLHEVKDVTGAGDTVLAIITAVIANGGGLEEAARLANIAAGIAIERIGCARISLQDLYARALSLV